MRGSASPIFTIELRGPIPEAQRPGLAGTSSGCDICQDVCPWNSREANTSNRPSNEGSGPPLHRLRQPDRKRISHHVFSDTPVSRARYTGFLRNVAVAMGNSGLDKFRAPLEKLAQSGDALVAEHALWALDRLGWSYMALTRIAPSRSNAGFTRLFARNFTPLKRL